MSPLAQRVGSVSRIFCAFLALSILFTAPVFAETENCSAPDAVQEKKIHDRLDKGEIVVGLENIGSMRFVTGRVLIDQPPEKVWPIMVNPFEFQKKITPRMKSVDVVLDKISKSVLKVTMDAFPIPDLTYEVESNYMRTEHGARIDFHRTAGTLKDFRGHWIMNPSHHGKKTELIYSMYLDPGFFVPQWIVRQGVKGELPKTLEALRKRIAEVYENNQSLEKKSIVAATPLLLHKISY